MCLSCGEHLRRLARVFLPQRPPLEVATLRKQIKLVDAVIYTQETPPLKRLLLKVGCSSPFVQLARHLTAVRAWCKQYLPGQRKPDVLRPGIVGKRGSIIIRTTTAMHGMSNRPPTPLPPSGHCLPGPPGNIVM